MIPKILQFHWFFDPLPAWAEGNLTEWRAKYPDWEVRLYREIPKDLPKALRNLLGVAPTGRTKADLLRYWLLHRDGGVYADLDTRPCRKIGNELLQHSAFHARFNFMGHNELYDICFLGSEPGHQVWLDMLKGCKNWSRGASPSTYFWSGNVLPDLPQRTDVHFTPLNAVVSSTHEEAQALCERGERPPLRGTYYLKHYHHYTFGLDPLFPPPKPPVLQII